MTDVVERILTFNAGREPERLRLKFQAMRRNAFAFLRGTAHLYWQDWSSAHESSNDAPLVWATGDLHLENTGSFLGDTRLVYFDLNDFDESALAPATWEVSRFLTSVHVGAASLELSASDATHLASAFLDAYVEALRDGKARWIERATATGMVKELLAGAQGRTREALLDSRTVVRRGRRTLHIDGKRALAVGKRERRHVSEALHRFARTAADPEFYDVFDVARRVAGTASLGLERFVVLVRGSGSPHGNWLLDLKAARPSALAAYLERPQPSWPNEADRIVKIQYRMQAISPALLHAVSIRPRYFILRELQPSEDRLALAHWHGKLGRLREVMVTIGHLVAWAQLRSSSRDGSARIDDLIEFAHQKNWRRDLLRSTRACAATVQRDWQTFRRTPEENLISNHL
jgi:uncharacterized protein (DUF2252 family)